MRGHVGGLAGVLTAGALACATLSVPTRGLGAQTHTAVDSAFEDLRRDGNGIGALQAHVLIGFDGTRAGAAIRAIAGLSGLDLTFDPALRQLDRPVTVRGYDRTAAVALLEVAAASQLRVRVSRRGDLVVLPLVAETPRTAPAPLPGRDTIQRAVALPTVHTQATAVEHETFQTSTNVGAISLTGRALASAPQFIEPDVMRSVQTLPGIASRSDYVAGFNVRGGEADQTLIDIVGYPIYSPFHLGGVFSTFIDPSVGRVELRSGGAPARFGGRLSGALDVQSAEPASNHLQGTAELSLVSTSASLGRGMGDGAGSWLVAARRTYADAIVNLFKPEGFPYHFQDAQGHFTHALPGGLRLSLTGYDGIDEARTTVNDHVLVSWGNSIAGATLSRAFANHPSLFGIALGDSVVVEQRFSQSRFDARVFAPDELIDGYNRVLDTRTGGSIAAHAGGWTETVGYELAWQRFAYDANAQLGSLGDLIPFDSVAQRLHSTSAYIDEVWRASPSLLVEAGGRVDAVSGHALGGVSPRFSAKYFVTQDFALTAGGGSYRQWIHSLGREEEPIEPLQFWVGGDSTTPISRARDAILGAERWLSPWRFVHVEAYYKRYDDLLIPNPFSDPAVHGDEFTVAGGTSYGAELLVRQLDTGGPFSGWLSYSYGVSARVSASGERYFPVQDRRHILNFVGSWRTGAYTLGTRLNVASGAPYTPLLGSFVPSRYDPATQRWVTDPNGPQQAPLPGAHDGARLPWYDRVDVSVTRDGHIRGASVRPYLSVLNLLNAHNPAAYLFDFERRSPERVSFPNFPFIPTFGVSVAF